MKKLAIILGVAVCVAGCSLIESESDKPIQNSFLIDVSDSVTSEIHAFEEGGVGHPTDGLWAAHITRYGILSNTEYARITKYEIKAATMYNSNELTRKAEVKEYISKLQTLNHGDTLEYAGSLVWAPLMHELEYLSQDSTTITTVYLVSDLLENNSAVNFYHPATRRLLKRDPEQVRKLFREKVPNLKYTNHIELVLVHEPYPETDRNEFYSLIVEQVYRPICTELGIKLTVRTNI